MSNARKTIKYLEDHIKNLKQDTLNAEGEISKIRTGELLKAGKAIAAKLSAERIEQVRNAEWGQLTRTRPALGEKRKGGRWDPSYYTRTDAGFAAYQYLTTCDADAKIQEMEDLLAKYAGSTS